MAILQAAANVSTVKSFVLTSSSTACLIPVPNKEGIVIDEGKSDQGHADLGGKLMPFTSQTRGMMLLSQQPGTRAPLMKLYHTTFMPLQRLKARRLSGNLLKKPTLGSQ